MPGKRRRPSIGLIFGGLVILCGFGYLVSGQISNNLVYFLTPGELLAKGSSVYNEPIRLGGQVVPHTVQWNAEALDLRFEIQDENGARVEVHSRNAPPQMFREGMGVVVEGKLTPAGVFESTNLMVKHSNEYRVPHKGEDPRETYRSLVREP